MKKILVLVLLFSVQVISQDYHLLIISGGPALHSKSPVGDDSFWNDAFLLREYCSANYFTSYNILYGSTGYDPSGSSVNANRYLEPTNITYAPATRSSVISALNDLKNSLAYNDILVIYIKGHGGVINGNGVFILQNPSTVTEYIYDYEFANWVNDIPCKKRVIINATCYSGAFKDNFLDYKTVFISSSNYNQASAYCDNINPDGGDREENEPWGVNMESNHGEFDYHMLNALRQSTIAYNNPVSSDLDDNEEISTYEMFNWAFNTNSNINQIPQLSGYNDLESKTYLNALEDYQWENTLVVDTLKETNHSHPKIVWGSYPTEDLGTITKYKIYRQIMDCEPPLPDGGDGIFIGTVTSSNFKFVDNSVTTGNNNIGVIYKIKAENSSNQSSSYSNSVQICGTLDWSQALFLTSGGIRLTWGPYQSTQVTGYRVYRNVNGQGFIQVGPTLSSSTYEFVDPDYSPTTQGNTLEYYVKAVLNYNTLSAQTNTVSTVGTNLNKDFSETEQVYDFSLSANYPNPFNPSTTIDYSLQKPSNVKLEVYDIYGSRVATLVDDFKNEGRYSVNFNASNLASGVYIYKLQTNDFISTKKMTLVK